MIDKVAVTQNNTDFTEIPLRYVLLRHPWMSDRLLAKVLDVNSSEVNGICKSDQYVQSVKIANGHLYAIKHESLATLPSHHRLNIARSFILDMFNPEIFVSSLSPGLWGSDADVIQKDRYVRFWVDMGECGVEALRLVQYPPQHYNHFVTDFVLTMDPGRLHVVANQVKSRWYGYNDIFVWVFGTGSHKKVRPAREYPNWLSMPKNKTVKNSIENRVKGKKVYYDDFGNNEIGTYVLLKDEDWPLMIYVGDNPLLDIEEIAFSVNSGEGKIERTKRQVERLLNMKVFTDNVVEDEPGRIVLSPLALSLFARRWNVPKDTMRRFHPWPQKKDEEGEMFYTVGALTRIDQHTRRVREFALSLVADSKRVERLFGGVNVRIDKTVGHRLLFKRMLYGVQQDMQWIIPDAKFYLQYWTRAQVDNKLYPPKTVGRTLYFEMDMATNSIAKLRGRIEKYAVVWKSLPDSALVWLTTGTPYREKCLIEEMKKYGIEGYVVLLDRLVLPRNDAWWGVMNPMKGKTVKYDTIGGMSPLRKVWASTEFDGYNHLFGVSTWYR